jgi:hypothetical protein
MSSEMITIIALLSVVAIGLLVIALLRPPRLPRRGTQDADVANNAAMVSAGAVADICHAHHVDSGRHSHGEFGHDNASGHSGTDGGSAL